MSIRPLCSHLSPFNKTSIKLMPTKYDWNCPVVWSAMRWRSPQIWSRNKRIRLIQRWATRLEILQVIHMLLFVQSMKKKTKTKTCCICQFQLVKLRYINHFRMQYLANIVTYIPLGEEIEIQWTMTKQKPETAHLHNIFCTLDRYSEQTQRNIYNLNLYRMYLLKSLEL